LQASDLPLEPIQFAVCNQVVIVDGRRLEGPNAEIAACGGIEREHAHVGANVPEYRAGMHRIDPRERVRLFAQDRTRARAADPAVIEEAYRTVRGVHDDGIAEQVIDYTGPLLGRPLPQYGDRDLRADPSHLNRASIQSSRRNYNRPLCRNQRCLMALWKA